MNLQEKIRLWHELAIPNAKMKEFSLISRNDVTGPLRIRLPSQMPELDNARRVEAT